MKVYDSKFIFISFFVGLIIAIIAWLGNSTYILPFQKNDGIVLDNEKQIYNYKNIFEKINASISLTRKNYHLEK